MSAGEPGSREPRPLPVGYRQGVITAITVTLGKQTGKVRVDGDLRGTYAGDADALTFKLGRTTGTARFTRNGKTTTVPMKQVADVFAPQGKGSATCSGDNLTLKAGTVTWSFVRDTDD